jgi:hypothetical protein
MSTSSPIPPPPIPPGPPGFGVSFGFDAAITSSMRSIMHDLQAIWFAKFMWVSFINLEKILIRKFIFCPRAFFIVKDKQQEVSNVTCSVG